MGLETNFVLPFEIEETTGEVLDYSTFSCCSINNRVNTTIEMSNRLGTFWKKKIIAQLIYPVREAIRNSFGHNDISEVNIGMWVGNLGVGYGIHDGGVYFKDNNVKKIWESRTKISSSLKHPIEKQGTSIGDGQGNGLIYDMTDKIFVDSSEGILYLAQTKSRLGIK